MFFLIKKTKKKKKRKKEQSIVKEKECHEHCIVFMIQNFLHWIVGYKPTFIAFQEEVYMPIFIHHKSFQNSYVAY